MGGPRTPTGIDPAAPDPQRGRRRAPLPRSGRVTRTASPTLPTTMASRPALPPTRSVCLGGGVHAASRRSSSAATRRREGRRTPALLPSPRAPGSPPARWCSAAQLRGESARTPSPPVEWVAGRPARSAGWRQVARPRMAAHGRRRPRAPTHSLPPPCSHARAQRAPLRGWSISTHPDTVEAVPRPRDTASSRRGCVPAWRRAAVAALPPHRKIRRTQH